MFAIVDIETCGGKFEFRKGRIIDICIVVHDGLTVVDKFSTLVNPECYISPYFTGISGITNEMVKDAPKFHDIARQVLEYTEGHIFVAHNVGFDYNFIKDEFRALGYTYRRETLCTVRLSRKLLPKRISYSLGRLCESLGIENEARHRAEGDAVATAKLFDILIQAKNQDPRYRNQGVEALMTRRVDKIKDYILNKLPEKCGVYYFLNKDKEIIYIGKSTNMYNRAIGHFRGETSKSRKMLNDLYNVDFVETGSELIALLLESSEIKNKKPLYNVRRKNKEFTHCIDFFTDAGGVINFKIVPTEESDNALLKFNTYSTARERLDLWIDDHELCLSHCGLTEKESSCFNHQLKKCNGICCGMEDKDKYNKRALDIVKTHSFSKSSFVIVDKGRNSEERAVILIEDNQYKGYGYLDALTQISGPEEFKNLIRPAVYYPDNNDLVRTWMQGKYSLKIIDLPEPQLRDTEF
ncbi:MAG TPA: exonuclease domain-containing protein [Bacteroidia bacterium]|nr:exonuclease domain-containing protein [Bacteroidia bacterium]